MHLIPAIAVTAALAGTAHADTMYKCIAPNGTVTYASQPCDAKAREARQFALPPPESEEAASARRKHDSDRLRLADRQFRQRQASLGTERRARPRSTGSRQGQTSNSKEAAERALAAKLNAARIGNCTTPRPEANCL